MAVTQILNYFVYRTFKMCFLLNTVIITTFVWVLYDIYKIHVTFIVTKLFTLPKIKTFNHLKQFFNILKLDYGSDPYLNFLII